MLSNTRGWTTTEFTAWVSLSPVFLISLLRRRAGEEFAMIFSQLRKDAIERVLLYSRGRELHLAELNEVKKRRVGVVLVAAKTRTWVQR